MYRVSIVLDCVWYEYCIEGECSTPSATQYTDADLDTQTRCACAESRRDAPHDIRTQAGAWPPRLRMHKRMRGTHGTPPHSDVTCAPAPPPPISCARTSAWSRSVDPLPWPLPSDVWECVLSFVPLRPRLLVAALVCRRWWSIVHALPVTLPPLPPAALAAALARLPTVTALDDLPQGVCAPPALRRVSLQRRGFANLAHAAAHLTHLTSLESLTLLPWPEPRLASALLAASAASLTHLSLRARRTLCGHSALPLLAAAALPRLASLSLLWDARDHDLFTHRHDAALLRSVLAAYASQLTSLQLHAVSDPPGGALLADLHFPILRRLVLDWVLTPTAGCGFDPSRQAPALTSFGVTVFPSALGTTALAALGPLLTHVRCEVPLSRDTEDRLMHTLSLLPSLRSLRTHSKARLQLLGPCTTLRTLVITGDALSDVAWEQLRLPWLTTLVLDCPSTRTTDPTALPRLLACFPFLTRLHLHAAISNTATAARWAWALGVCENAGLDLVTVATGSAECASALRGVGGTLRWLQVRVIDAGDHADLFTIGHDQV